MALGTSSRTTNLDRAVPAAVGAFISYSREESTGLAIALQAGLERFAKPWYRLRAVRVFRDESNMSANPDLKGTIEAELVRSGWFILLASTKAASSLWVETEIQWWLNHRSVDRIMLVQSAGEIVWDPIANQFDSARSSAIPPILARAYRHQPRWIDLRWFGAPEGVGAADPRFIERVADLAAPIHGKERADIVGENVRQHRRTVRLARSAIATLAILLALSLIATVVALQQRQNANHQRDQAQRNEREAKAQADASEALLYSSVSPSRAIGRAVRASTLSSSTTVRSSMLAVSESVRRLERAATYPEAMTGHPARSSVFTPDGRHVVVFGDGSTSGTTYVETWDFTTGSRDGGAELPVSGLDSVTALSATSLVGCSPQGLMRGTLNARPASVTWLERTAQESAAVHSCWTASTNGGSVAVVRTGDGSPPVGYYVGVRGEPVRVPEATSVAWDPRSRVAVLAGQRGAIQVGPSGQARVLTRRPAEARYANARGEFVIRVGSSHWATVRQGADGPVVHKMLLPNTAVDVAPVLDIDKITGELAWVDARGGLGWTRNGKKGQLHDSRGSASWRPYRPRLIPLSGKDFVAVFGSTASIVRPPTGDRVFGDASGDQQPKGPLTSWYTAVVRDPLGSAAKSGAEAVLSECPSSEAVLLRGQFSEDGALLVRADPTPTRLDGAARFLTDCSVEVRSDSVKVIDDLSHDEAVLLDPFVADSVVYSPDGAHVAVVKAGEPVQILSTASEADLPRPWDISEGGHEGHGALASFGSREVSIETSEDAASDVVFSTDREQSRVRLTDLAALKAIRPDGLGAAVSYVGKPGQELVDADGQRVTLPRCTDQLAYQPAEGYENSVSAAEAQVPVGVDSTGRSVDCRSNSYSTFDPSHEIVSYDISPSTGRIVAWHADRLWITTWQRTPTTTPITIEGPPTAKADTRSQVSISADSNRVLIRNGQRAEIYQRSDSTWQLTVAIPMTAHDIVAMHLVDDGSLAAAVTSAGAFEIYDASTGRLLAGELKGGLSDIAGFSSKRVGDSLVIYFGSDDSLTDTGTMTMPVSVHGLRRHLCAVYHAPDCPPG
jgi:hypothetical protein